tara:strand:+ start:7633 stop:9006 length:1374 start_codon:yes stop_codon:yes gene_type:complete
MSKKNYVLRKFPLLNEPDEVIKTKDTFYYLKNGKKILDSTSGWTTYATLGFNNKRILNSIIKQSKKFCHIDYNIWNNGNLNNLAKKLIGYSSKELDRVYFSGNSGSEAIEAAMKLSYQIHFNNGDKKKTNYIGRVQSFHGATLQAISVSELPFLDIFENISPKNVYKIHQHNFYKVCDWDKSKNKCACKNKPSTCTGKFKDEKISEYLERSVKYLEEKIIEVGSDKIAAFIGETQLASLVGDVPPLKNYWKKISLICKKNNIHLIMDEVYCGMGRSGKMYNYMWDDFEPDFVCLGKNTTSGHIPFSFVLTKSKFEEVIGKGIGRIRIGHTFQGFALGVAACEEYLDIIKEKKLLKRVNKIGSYMRKILSDELHNHEYFDNIRGRGLMFSLQHKTQNNDKFSKLIYEKMLFDFNILTNCKFHRTSFTPSFTISKNNVDYILDSYLKSFKNATNKLSIK